VKLNDLQHMILIKNEDTHRLSNDGQNENLKT
jgi:hypothetical protein